MAKKATMLAIPAIVVFGDQFAQTAQAGPIVYAICVAGCIAINPAWAALCPVLCAAGGLSPSP
jgi:uncharacterized RDD family membrane protein YckC